METRNPERDLNRAIRTLTGEEARVVIGGSDDIAVPVFAVARVADER